MKWKYSLLLLTLLLSVMIMHGQVVATGGVTIKGGSILGIIYGPPLYLGSSVITSGNFPITPIFTSTTPTSVTCGGDCLNSIRYTTINPATDPLIRATDATSSCGAAGQSFNSSKSGGDNEMDWSINNDLVFAWTTGGVGCILHLDLTNPYTPQVINNPSPLAISSGSSFSWTVDRRIFSNISVHVLTQNDINPAITTLTPTTLADLTGAGICPGLPHPFAVRSGTILNITSDDDTFGVGLSDVGNQNTAFWVVIWSRTKGCSVHYVGPTGGYTDFNSVAQCSGCTTGQVWAFCNSGTCGPSTAPLGVIASTGCYGAPLGHGMHELTMSHNSAHPWTMETISGTWTGGACAGSSSGYAMWEPGTLNGGWCAATNGCPSHTSIGTNKIINDYFLGATLRNANTPISFTTLTSALSPVLEDWHGGWPDLPALNDTMPYIIGTDLITTANGGVYNPKWPHNMIYAISPSAVPPSFGGPTFGFTFSCGDVFTGRSNCTDGADDYFQGQQGVLAVSRDGKYLSLASTMLHNLGTDSGGKHRQDVFIIPLM